MSSTPTQCKGQCGFYGSDIWNGYCSKCYQKEEPSNSPSSPSHPIFNELLGKIDIGKKVTQKKLSNFKNIIKLTKEFLDERPGASTIPFEYKEAKNQFYDSFKTPHEKKYLSEIVPILASKIDKKEPFSDIEVYSKEIQELYIDLETRISSGHHQKNITADRRQHLLDAIENFSTFWIHKPCFLIEAEKEENLKIDAKIKSIEWIRPTDIDAKINLIDERERKMIEECILSMHNFSESRPNNKKLASLLDCCDKIFKVIQIHRDSLMHGINSLIKISDESTSEDNGSSIANADDFLPIFIYVIIRAKPRYLFSNVQYISRFSMHSRLYSGKCSYFFTHLKGAIDFIKKFDHTSLGVTKEEFERRMNGIHPPSLPYSKMEQQFYKQEVSLFDLNKRTEKLKSDMDIFEHDLIDFNEDVQIQYDKINNEHDIELRSELCEDTLENPFVLIHFNKSKPL